MRLEKYIGKRVMVTQEGFYFGTVGKLLLVVPSFLDGEGVMKVHVEVDGAVIVLPVTEIAIMLPNNA